MPIDAYSICPGGTGRKIKFCCGDLLGQLQQINRMLEGEQFVACLKHVEQVRQEHPDRACLLAIKGMLLREAGEVENAVANATEFVEKHPQNPAAQAESAIVTAAVEGGRAAMGPFQRAMAASADGIQNRVYEAMGTIAGVLLSEGELAAGRAMLQLQMAVAPDDEQPVEMLTELYRTGNVPLLFKDDPPMAPCPPDAPWKSRFEEAMTPMQHAHWQAAAEKLSALAEEVPDSAVLWRNLATVRGWLADSFPTASCRDCPSRDPPPNSPTRASVIGRSSAVTPCTSSRASQSVWRPNSNAWPRIRGMASTVRFSADSGVGRSSNK